MRRIFLLLLFSLNSLNFFAQTEETKPKNWIVKWNATAAVDVFSFPTVQFAVERKLNNYFSVQAEYGIQLYGFPKSDTVSVKNYGHRVIIEGRFYIFNYLKKDKSKTRKSDGLYTGLQLSYRKNSYNFTQEYYLNETDSDIQTDVIGVKKEVYAINVCFGYQIPFHNFILEPYVYLGYFNRNIENFDREYDESAGHVPVDDIHYFGSDLTEESDSYGNVSFGLRLGYKF
ncbi:MAG TPA: hypothetical protein VLB74_00665 [Flavobacterium sp.]|uniref:hypothetical protein n=1 Tax=Flavobacterium sp. TaxID=239 RepID=UPI002C379ABF|nr:hypothetical protein [Flavobacterium sp.]HSD13136.1 hypothetical protein [Flavobacterium sp.]